MVLRQPQDERDVRQFTVAPDDDGIRVDRWFKRHLPQIGFGMVGKWARTGQLRVDGKRVKPEDRLSTGQVLRVPPAGDNALKQRKIRELSEDDRELAREMLVAKSKSALVLNKPPGLATQGGTKTTRHIDGLLDAYADAEDPRPRLVHRLDKDTSGILLVARTPGSAAFFSKHFSGRSAKKVYWALVTGVPDVAEGTIEAPIGKQPGTGGEKMHVDEAGGQRAVTRYRVIERAGNRAAWVEMMPLTGRTHQLRVHMTAIGHPIVGDGKYGGQDAFLTGSISRKMHLHARRLVIEGPGGEVIDEIANLPEHFAASMEQLGFDPSRSDAAPLEFGRAKRTPEEEKKAARQHAKQYRKERRGERKQRGEANKEKPPRGKLGKKSPAGAKRKGPAPKAVRGPAKGSSGGGAAKGPGPKGRR